ncbi:hypothetical protein [Candidatus Karelsulcia muelleri]|nr:hypothetical protein [Candidatus Karelsulcia muelleri]
MYKIKYDIIYIIIISIILSIIILFLDKISFFIIKKIFKNQC